MSVRAYRINEIRHEGIDSFNLWRHTDFLLELEKYGSLSQLDDDLSGILTIPVESLEEILQENPNIVDPDTKEQLLKDIEWAKARDDYDISYYCF